MSAPVTVYRTTSCPYCVAAKRLLSQRQIAFDEVFLDQEPEKLNELKERYDWRTVPMVFVGSHFVGGYTDLKQLADNGELAKLLAAPQ